MHKNKKALLLHLLLTLALVLASLQPAHVNAEANQAPHRQVAPYELISAMNILRMGNGLPALIEKNHGLAETFEHYHVLAAEIGYWLIGLHAAAAIFHKHVVKDNTLERMLPQRSNS